MEDTINPATGGYFFPKVTVKLFDKGNEGALVLGSYLRDAYQEAEDFSQLLAGRVRGADFFKTPLLRRLGSSMEAGRRTIARRLGLEVEMNEDADEAEDAPEDAPADDAVPLQRGHPRRLTLPSRTLLITNVPPCSVAWGCCARGHP